MFGIPQIIKYVAILLSIVIVAAGLWYVMNLKADLAISRENSAKLEQGIESQKLLMQQMREDIAEIQKVNKELHELANTQRAEVEALSNKFSQDARGQSRDFGSLAKEKPGLIERLINRGTRNAMRCLEIASGAPRTKEELEAVTSSQINKECPSIANPNYRGAQ
jgi:hypothetical protein